MLEERCIQVPLDHLRCLPQVREQFDEESLSGLADSLRATGQLVPIRVRPDGDRFIVVDGERRFRAAKIAGLNSLMVVIDERDLADTDVLIQQLTANIQRANLAPLEKARSIERLMKAAGWTGGQAAAQLGVSPASITRLLRLLELPDDVQQLIDEGKLPPSTAYSLAQVSDPEQRSELIRRAKSGDLTRDAAVGHVRQSKHQKATSLARGPSRMRFCIDPFQSITVACNEPSIDHVISLLEEILGKARKARTQGWELQTFARALKDQAKGGQP